LYPGTAEFVLTSRYYSAMSATGTLVLADTTNVNYMFDGARVYAKGSVVLSMLRYVVGDSAFKDILAAWAADPAVRLGVAETVDFQRVAETVSGVDLDAFFRQWVTDGTGYPVYKLSAYWRPEGSAYRVWVTVTQAQKLPESNVAVFEMPLVIAVQTSSGEERVEVENNRAFQTFDFAVADRPRAVTLDPDHWILRAEVDTVSTTPVPSYPNILAIAPNPARNQFALRYTLATTGSASYTIYDVRGRRVVTQSLPSAGIGVLSQTIDTSAFASGVYFLRVESPAGRATQKFVVLR
jgi:hypothetical protein